MKKIIENFKKMGLYGILFFAFIFVFAIANVYQLIKYYVTDEVSNNQITEMGNAAETTYITNFTGKNDFINLNGFVRNASGQNEMNGVIKLNNGYLLTTMDQCSEERLDSCAQEVFVLNDYLKEKEIPFLYVTTPYTSCKYDPQLPTGVEDYGNENTDRFLAKLENGGVPTMDLREEMYLDGIDHYSMMYKTDHHWNTQCGFYAYTKLAEYMENTLECEIDPQVKDIDNYTITTYEEWHLGSRGQRTGIYYAGIDDFELITPNFETSLNKGDETGTFAELAYDMEPLSNRDYSSRYTYDYVLQDATANYTNNLSYNDKKILVITDSMGLAVGGYMAMSFGEIRWVSNYTPWVLTPEMIDEYEPDMVIMLYYSGRISEADNAYDFAF